MTAQLALRHWSGMRLTWIDGTAVVHTGSEPSPTALTVASAAANGSVEPSVVVTSHTVRLLPHMMDELADVLAMRLPRDCPTVRLVAWDGACSVHDRPAPA